MKAWGTNRFLPEITETEACVLSQLLVISEQDLELHNNRTAGKKLLLSPKNSALKS